MRFVPIKTEDQLDLQALHRVRDRLVARRASVINQIRAFLLERGISFRKGPASLRRHMPPLIIHIQGESSFFCEKLAFHRTNRESALVSRGRCNKGPCGNDSRP